jgi:hypothetical protein
VILTIRRSKTDQDGTGRKVGIPLGRTIHCPVRALEVWLTAAQIEGGPIFRPVDRAGLGRSTLWRRRILDPSRSGGPDRVFGPQPTRRLCDECDAGRGLDTQDQAADRSRLRCHAFALHQGGRAFPWERRRHSPLTARITVRLRQIGVPTCSDVAIAQKAIIGCWAKPIQPAYPVNCSSLDAF